MLAIFRHVTRPVIRSTHKCQSFRNRYLRLYSSTTDMASPGATNKCPSPSDGSELLTASHAKRLRGDDLPETEKLAIGSLPLPEPTTSTNKRPTPLDESEPPMGSDPKKLKVDDLPETDNVTTGSLPLPQVDTSTMLSEQPSTIDAKDAHPTTGEEIEEKPTTSTSKQGRKGNNAHPGKSRKGKEKDTKNVGRKSRRGFRKDQGEGDAAKTAEEGEAGEKSARLPKKMCALLIGFCGTGCSGMQIQPNVKTIEGVLFNALVKAGAVSKDNADDPVKVSLQRAARTDAGVHAAGNLVSLKMITVIPDLLEKINAELPPEIRLWGYVRVQNSFNARGACDSRRYTYFFPSYCLLPPRPGSGLHRQSQSQSSAESINFWDGITPEMTSAQVLERKRAWRVSEAQMARLRETAEKYVGTHNFHNFTVGREFTDRSNHRFMKKIEIADPAVYGQTEWISVMFHGQSFMLHQRKMMSGLVLSSRTNTPAEVIEELYGPKTVLVPKMPSLGLLLEYPIFDTYNLKVKASNEKLEGDEAHAEYRPPISFEIYREQIDTFKQKYIYEAMREVEDKNGVFDAWIRLIDSYAGEDLSYLNPKGIIPPGAVIKKGEKRKNPLREKKMFDTTDYTNAKSANEKEGDEMEDEDDEGLEKDKAILAEMEG